MSKKADKTNVMRILDQKKLEYKHHMYDKNLLNGVEVAESLGENPDKVFKTLVTIGKSKTNYVFMIPVKDELDLKKAAKAAGEKSMEMILQKELFPLTGYIHGGCSPIGMKKQFQTFIHESAGMFQTIYCSAGRVGYQVELGLEEIQKVIKAECADIIKK